MTIELVDVSEQGGSLKRSLGMANEFSTIPEAFGLYVFSQRKAIPIPNKDYQDEVAADRGTAILAVLNTGWKPVLRLEIDRLNTYFGFEAATHSQVNNLQIHACRASRRRRSRA